MMNKQEWLQGIYKIVTEISDRTFQERIWIKGEGPQVSSWTEVICRLFDDYDFDSFLDEYATQIGISSTLHKHLYQLRDKLNTYQQKETDAEIVVDPEWQQISQFAQDILGSLENELARHPAEILMV